MHDDAIDAIIMHRHFLMSNLHPEDVNKTLNEKIFVFVRLQ